MGILGAKLRQLRGKQSLYEVSKGSGVVTADLNRYETEKYLPRPSTLKKLADYFDVPYGALRILLLEEQSTDMEDRKVLLDWARKSFLNQEKMAIAEQANQDTENVRLDLLLQFETLLEQEGQPLATKEIV